MIFESTVNNLGLKTYEHPQAYPLDWVHNYSRIQVTKQCKLKFFICAKFIDEVVVDVIPLDMCGVILYNPYLWDRGVLYYRMLSKYKLIKDGKDYLVTTHKNKKKFPLMRSNQVK